MILEKYASLYRQNLTESVLPFWLNHTLDRKYGGYFSGVDRRGEVYDPRKYIWMQGRALWTFSTLYTSFEPREEFREAAEIIFRFVSEHARAGEPRCWFSTTRDGRPVFFQRKPYSAVFVALGLIAYSKISKDSAHLAEAIELFWQIDIWIHRPTLLGRPSLEGGIAYSQLADIMVQALLALELMEVHEDPRYEQILQRCISRVMAHYEPKHRLLLENASQDPNFRELPEGRLVCPGSILEVAWFLLRVLEKTPDPTVEQLLLQSIPGALEFGWDRAYGGLYYFMDIEGRPAPALESNMKLWWPHTEAINALVLAYAKTREPLYLEWLQRVHDYTWRTFVDHEFGEWFGYCGRRGEVVTEMKGGAYKCAFHVPRCLLYSMQTMENLPSGADR